MGNAAIKMQVLEAVHGLAAYGLGPGIGGHVSIRVPGEAQFYINAFDRSFEEMRRQDIALLDMDGKVLECESHVSQGLTFHHGIYRQRPDVGAIVHTHGFWMTTHAALGRPPRCLHNLTTYFEGRTCVSPSDDFAAIASALGAKDIAIVIPWHGVITLGTDVGQAAALHVTYDYAARMDLTLPADTPMMPLAWREQVMAVLKGTDYLELTWELIRRKGADAFDGKRITPGLAH